MMHGGFFAQCKSVPLIDEFLIYIIIIIVTKQSSALCICLALAALLPSHKGTMSIITVLHMQHACNECYIHARKR